MKDAISSDLGLSRHYLIVERIKALKTGDYASAEKLWGEIEVIEKQLRGDKK